MAELGPGGKWAIIRDIAADPGGCMAVIDSEVYRVPCFTHNPDIPVYSKKELSFLKSIPKSGSIFRGVQKIKKVFPSAKIVGVVLESENEWKRE